MKKFLDSHHGASKGAALIIVLALLTAVVSPTSGAPSPTPSTTASPSPGCRVIASAVIASPGNFYKVGDYLDPGYGTLCAPADNFGFRLQVASVNPSNGQVTSVTIVPGIGYSVPPSNPIKFGGSASGTGFMANCTFNALP